jgi:hypothetical protein
MAQGGWALLHDKGQLTADGVPPAILAGLQKAVNELKKADTPRSLAFAPDGGWVVLSHRDYREQGLPRDLSERLAEHKRKGVGVRCVAFNRQCDWFLLDEANGCFSSKSDHPALAMLNKLREGGETLRLIAFAPGVCSRGCALEHKPVRRIKGVLSTTWSCADGRVVQWAVLPPPVPALDRQRDVKRSLNPPAMTIREAGPLKQQLPMIRFTGKPSGIQVIQTCEVTLCTSRLVPLLAGQTPTKVELSRDLAAVFTTVSGDMKSRIFKDFLTQSNLRRQKDESDVDFAARTFLYICQHFKYVFPNPAKVDVIEAAKGDCGGLSRLFNRIMRANGVPSRILIGRWARSGKPAAEDSLDGQLHVKVEFFARGIGWVGVDCAGGVNAKGNPLVFFANDPGDFVVLDVEFDRLVKFWPDDSTMRRSGSQNMEWRYRGTPGTSVQVSVEWTVSTLGK